MTAAADDAGPNPFEALEQSLASTEMERLKRLGDALGSLGEAASRIDDPEERAALQDANLAAFEAMTGDVGEAALTRVRALVAQLSDELDEFDAAAEGVAASLKIAVSDIEAERDQTWDTLVAALKARLEDAATEAGDLWEPFEHRTD